MLTTEYSVTERSESMSESRNRKSRKNDDDEVHSDQLQGVPDWLQEFRHGLVDESVPEHRDASSSSHELPLEPRAKVVSGKHRGTKLRHLLENQDYKGFVQMTHWYDRAQSGTFR